MRKEKIISVIEDDTVFCTILQEHIEANGYQAAIYYSVEDFLSQQMARPFAIILDHFLKNNKIGFDSLDQIKKKMPGTPIIYLTRLTKEELPPNFDKSGIYTYIGKDSASLIRLRTALDNLESGNRSFLKRLFKSK